MHPLFRLQKVENGNLTFEQVENVKSTFEKVANVDATFWRGMSVAPRANANFHYTLPRTMRGNEEVS